MLVLITIIAVVYGSGIFIGYQLGYDKADRANNAGWSTLPR